jgi:hypothetical protein
MVEDEFVHFIGLAESQDNWRAWGDDGFAVGRYQDHASYYATWGPKPADFAGEERTWDWCFNFAIRRFWRAARKFYSTKTGLEIAMARHLHGQLVFTGWDQEYERHLRQVGWPEHPTPDRSL